MFKKISMVLSVVIVCSSFDALESQAKESYLRPFRRARTNNWHGNYAHAEYGQSVALVVPPTANMQTNWSWGAPSASFSRLDQQFSRCYQETESSAGGFRRTPPWPSNMRQFGAHYVRGPWYPTQR